MIFESGYPDAHKKQISGVYFYTVSIKKVEIG